MHVGAGVSASAAGREGAAGQAGTGQHPRTDQPPTQPALQPATRLKGDWQASEATTSSRCATKPCSRPMEPRAATVTT